MTPTAAITAFIIVTSKHYQGEITAKGHESGQRAVNHSCRIEFKDGEFY
jgi:hypothetical protein